MHYKSLFSNISHLTLMQVFNFIAPLLVLPYLTEVLGVSNYGKLAVYFSIIQMCFVITDFGFNLSATRKVAKHHYEGSAEKINVLLGNVFFIKVFLNLFVLIVLVFFWGVSETTFALLLSVISQSYIFTWLFQGIEKMKWIMLSTVLIRTIYIISVFILVKDDNDTLIALYSFGIANLTAAFFSVLLIFWLGYVPKWSSFDSVKQTFKSSAEFFYSRAAVALYSSSSVFLLGIVSGNSSAGLYSVCEQLYKAAQAALSPVSQALYPFMEKRNDWKLFNIVTFSVGFALIVFSLPILVVKDELILFIFGRDFLSAAVVFPIFVFTAIVNFWGVCYGYPALTAVNKIRVANYSVIIGAIVHANILLLLYALDFFTPLYVALSVLITEFLVFIIRFYYVSINLKKQL